jgi:Putative Flp pilus-assembly TadE/G-like
MQPKWNVWRSERGAIFVQVGIAVFVLMALNVFVVDYGMMWVARRQAQNAADAAALAGAVARAYDDFGSPPSSGGIAANTARNVAQHTANQVWQAPVAPVVSFDCPPPLPASGPCVQVDVHRDAAHSNPISTLFGPILSIASQDVRATATGIVRFGNAIDCLRPIAFADEWVENTTSPATTYPNHRFERYNATGGLVSNPDVYTPPSDSVAGNTTWPTDVGERIIWEIDRPILTTAPITRHLVVALSLPTPGGPGHVYTHMKYCSGDVIQIGQTLPVEEPTPGFVQAGFDHLMSLDTTVDWNEGQNRIEDSCAPSPSCGPISPRLVPVALFDPAKFQLGRSTGDWVQSAVGCPTNNPCITVTNIVGFFIHGQIPSYGPHGHFLRYPGMSITGPTTLAGQASWLVIPQLVR